MNARPHLAAACLAIAFGCSAPRSSAPSAPGAGRVLAPLALRLALPAGAKVEDRSQPGQPHRVNVTSMEPELIFELEEVDAQSPPHARVLQLATRAEPPGARAELRRDDQGPDGTFSVVVDHHAAPGGTALQSYTVDMRVRAGSTLVDCSGTTSSWEAAERLQQTCRSVMPL